MVQKISNINERERKLIEFYSNFTNVTFSELITNGYTGVLFNYKANKSMFIHKAPEHGYRKKLVSGNILGISLDSTIYNIIQGYFSDYTDNLYYYDHIIATRNQKDCNIFVIPPIGLDRSMLKSINLDFPKNITANGIFGRLSSITSKLYRKLK